MRRLLWLCVLVVALSRCSGESNTGPVGIASVNVSTPTTTLEIGESAQLSAIPLDAGGHVIEGMHISWSTSNAGVVSVSGSGFARGIAAGSASIAATAGDQSGSVQLTVVAPSAAPVATVEVTPASVTMLVGQTAQLVATARDGAGNDLFGRPITWTTSDQAMATVTANGAVAGVAPGTVLISAASEGRSGSATVTVASPPPQIASGGLVYVKDDNVWIADPSGTIQHQLTTGGGYRSPTMADDGTIGVVHNKSGGVELVRLTPAGAVRGRFDVPQSLNVLLFAALSPDGQTFAFTYAAGEFGDKCFAFSSTARNPCDRLAFTPSDRWQRVEGTTPIYFDPPGGGVGRPINYRHMTWLDNDLLLVFATDWYVRVFTREPGAQSSWLTSYTTTDYETTDGDLAPDTRTLVLSQRLNTVSSTGQDIIGPYEVAIWRTTPPDQAMFQGSAQTSGQAASPTFSPDGKAWAFSDDRGILLNVLGENQLRLVIPGGRQPNWGPYVVR